MSDRTCAIEGCNSPAARRRSYCNHHYMRMYRYGDPHHKTPPAPFVDLLGKRFGTLVCLQRVDAKWLCQCDCGVQVTRRAGELNRAGAGSTCGLKANHRRSDVVYHSAHGRVSKDRGTASTYPCVDCDGTARHWSYNHTDPNEIQSDLGPYSVSPDHYSPRCVPCHKRFDLDYRARTG